MARIESEPVTVKLASGDNLKSLRKNTTGKLLCGSDIHSLSPEQQKGLR